MHNSYLICFQTYLVVLCLPVLSPYLRVRRSQETHHQAKPWRLGGEGDLLLEARPARPTPRAAHSAPPPPPRVLQSWNSELYPGRTAPEHVGEARRPRMEHVAMWGEGGGLPDKHPSVGMTVGKVFMCLFVFVKRKTRKD